MATFKLNTGADIPCIGLGTWKSEPGQVRAAVKCAIGCGYRHIDAALIYGNETEVGQGIRDSGIRRSELFITSKLWNTHQTDVRSGLEMTLKALGTEYLDLYLIHWPVRLIPNDSSELLPVNPDGSRSVDRTWDQAFTWQQMEEVHRSGKVRAIGLANWSIPYLKALEKTWKVVPAVNQVELHPFLPQHDLVEFCRQRGILMEAYSPLGSSGAPITSDEEITSMAAKYRVPPTAILISYHVNKGVVVLPKSVNPDRIAKNLNTVQLEREDLVLIDQMAAKGKARRFNTPLFGWDLGFDDWYSAKKV